MEVIVNRQFQKDALKFLDKPNQLALAAIIENLQQVNAISHVKDLKKLKGYKNAYRIKMGDYRIGFLWLEGSVHLSRILHRKDIYRYFP